MSWASYLPRVWMGSQISAKLLPTAIRPLSAHVKLTENCQAKCISCDYWKARWQDEITTERAIRLLNEISDAGVRSLRLTGGEPLLRRDLFKILDEANTSRFKRIILQTNGLLIKKLHKEINESPISDLCVSVDGMKETNDRIRGIDGYFDLAFEGVRLLQKKRVNFAVTLNGISSSELEKLAEAARSVGAGLQHNILSRSLYFIQGADLDAMWPKKDDVGEITRFVRDTLHRPTYEVEYIRRYYAKESLEEPSCVLGYLQMFVLSNGDVMTGCYSLKPVGNILRDSVEAVLASEAYARQCEAMVRRECPGCTCGIESSLAMKHAGSSALFELKRLWQGAGNNVGISSPATVMQDASQS